MNSEITRIREGIYQHLLKTSIHPNTVSVGKQSFERLNIEAKELEENFCEDITEVTMKSMFGLNIMVDKDLQFGEYIFSRIE